MESPAEMGQRSTEKWLPILLVGGVLIYFLTKKKEEKPPSGEGEEQISAELIGPPTLALGQETVQPGETHRLKFKVKNTSTRGNTSIPATFFGRVDIFTDSEHPHTLDAPSTDFGANETKYMYSDEFTTEYHTEERRDVSIILHHDETWVTGATWDKIYYVRGSATAQPAWFPILFNLVKRSSV